MTAKKGMLWKTPWNRGRGTPIPNPLNKMWFFSAFEQDLSNIVRYETAADLTILGASLPFWYAVVGINPGNQYVDSANILQTPYARSDSSRVYANGGSGGVGYTIELPVPSTLFLGALFVIVKEVGTDFGVRSILNDQAADWVTAASPFPPGPPSPLVLYPGVAAGGLHGFAGGAGEPTLDQVHQWFADLKDTGVIPAIAGMTSHRYTAANTPGTVPAVLTNLGSEGAGQNMDLTVVSGAPVPVNQQLSVRYNW